MKKKIYFITMLSIVFALKSFGQCSLGPNPVFCGNYIASGNFGSIGLHGAGGCGYADYSSAPTSTICRTPGQPYVVTASVNNPFNQLVVGVAMWVDWNKDNVFEASEVILTGNSSTPYSYTISPNIAAGNYKVRMSLNTSGGVAATSACTIFTSHADGQITIADQQINNLAITGALTSKCIGANSGTLSVTNAVGASVVWSNGGALAIVGSNTLTTATFSNVYNGIETITALVTYSNGCNNSVSTTHTISPNPALGAVNIVRNDNNSSILCENSIHTLMYTLSIFYGTVTNVLWPDGSSAATTTVQALTGNYNTSVTLTRNDGCVFTTTVALPTATTQPPVLTQNISPSATVCTKQNVNLSYNFMTYPGYNFIWGNGYNATGITVNALADTIITVTYNRNNFACPRTFTTAITIKSLPVVSVANATVCAGKAFTITPGGATTYSYSSGSAVVTPTAATAYTVTGTALGCTSLPQTFTITPTSPVIIAPSTVICLGNSHVIVPSGAVTYTYSTGKNFGSIYTYTPGVGTNTVTGNVNFPYTSYSVTGTDANGCFSAVPAVVNVTVSANPFLNLPYNAATEACVGVTYTIIPTDLFRVSSIVYSTGSAIVTPTASGIINYTAVATSSIGGCTASFIGAINVQPITTLTITSNNTNLCLGQSTVLNGANNWAIIPTYTWSPGVSSIGSTTISVTPTTTTTYSLIAKDYYSCPTKGAITVSVSACTGINEVANSNLVSIYPNPANDFMTVSLVEESAEATSIYIINALGEIVLAEKATSSNTTLNTENLKCGIYFIKVESKHGSAIKKFIKQ